MDVMDIRRRLMMGMGSNRPRMASGVFTTLSSGQGATITITHGLGTRKLFFIAQLINENHANFDNSSRYQNILVYGLTKEALAIDTQQTYSFNGGNQVSFVDTGTGNSYPSGVYCYFPAVDGTVPSITGIQRPNSGLFAISDNEVSFTSNYTFPPNSRWEWRAYAID